MKRMISVLLMVLGLSTQLIAAENGALEEGLTNPGYVEKPDWFKASFLDLREDLEEAVSQGRRLMLYFYQDGCPYCEKLIRDNFAQHEIVDKTRQHFDVVSINMWGDKELTGLDGEQTTEKAFSRRARVQYTPTLLFLDEAGNVALRVNGYYPPHKFMAALDYVARKKEGELSFRDYYATQSPRKASGKLHVEPGFLPTGKLARKPGDRPLLVLFEQKVCLHCDELHGDVFRREETRRLMQAFDIALVDIWSKGTVQTPDGRTLKVRDWVKELKVQYAPSMLFFNARGEEVFRTEAYLRAFHTQSAMDYVASGAYREQPEFQRFVQSRADHLEEQGVEVDLWK